MNQPDALFFNKKDKTLWIRLGHKVTIPKTGAWVVNGTEISTENIIKESQPVYKAAKANQSLVTVYYQIDTTGTFIYMITPAVDDSNMVLVSTYNQKGATDLSAVLTSNATEWESFVQKESDDQGGDDDNNPK
jgi:hypothetical protein